MDDNKMGFVDYFWAGALFIMAMLLASCSPILNEEEDVICYELYQPVCAGGELFSNDCYAMKAGYDNDELTPAMCIDYEPGYTGPMEPCPFCPEDS